MNFDVVIGNPPYQEMTGGGRFTESSMPLYNEFIEKAIDIGTKYTTMIVPSRWLSGGKGVLDAFRNKIVESKQLEIMYNFEDSKEVFPSVGIAGGINYFLINKEYANSEVKFYSTKRGKTTQVVRDISKYKYTDSRGNYTYMIISDNDDISIIDKVLELGEDTLGIGDIHTFAFDIPTDFEDSPIKTGDKEIKVFRSNNRITYTDIGRVTRNNHNIHKYKVCTGKLSAESGGKPAFGNKASVITKPFILGPNEVCTGSFIVLGFYDSLEDANIVMNYFKSKFTRFLIFCTMSGMHISPRNCLFIPKINMEIVKDIPSDKYLYSKYNLNDEDIKLIEDKIKDFD